jgi:hypothetical protein
MFLMVTIKILIYFSKNHLRDTGAFYQKHIVFLTHTASTHPPYTHIVGPTLTTHPAATGHHSRCPIRSLPQVGFPGVVELRVHRAPEVTRQAIVMSR